jgi:glycosyltransferase involved in cell wall biosynthesis
MPTTPEISVVVPVYGCRDCIDALYQRLKQVLDKLSPVHEIVLVDDHSPDGAWTALRALAEQDRSVVALRLSRNFGQHAAITAGLAHCKGSWAVVMDCDLQDPPEEIPRLYEVAKAGHDVVFARRKEKKHSLFRRAAARAFFLAINFFARSNLHGSYGSFSIISRKVIDAFLELQDRDRHYLFILQWLGFDAADIEYQHAERYRGQSSYSLRALARHAFDGVFFQTTILLRWIVYVGFWISLTGVLLAVYFVYQYFVHDIYPGWTSLAVLILLIGGFIIASTGIAGLYVGKIFEQVKGRPLYVIDQAVNRSADRV